MTAARLIVVTGTGTGQGKTVCTAALAACAIRAGQRVAVVKPVQTGVAPGEPGDLAEVGRLTGLTDLHELVRYREPLAPATAARRIGEPGPDLAALAERTLALSDRDLVLVEGAGGVLVRFNQAGDGICQLIQALTAAGGRPEIVLVVRAGLGSLHDAAAAAGALAGAGLSAEHLVIGSWPAAPGLAERCNLVDLPDYAGAPLHGVLEPDAGRLPAAAFSELADRCLAAELGGGLEIPQFLASQQALPPTKEGVR